MAVTLFDPSGIESFRSNGYRDTSMALAELIDNSIQAGARKVDILLFEKKMGTEKRRESLVYEIAVVDNGDGMTPEVLEKSLRFGGGTKYNAKSGLGKFGMGLPNSSSSQCPRFEVYSWQNPEHIFYDYFDFEEIKRTNSEYLPEPSEVPIPKHIRQCYSDFYKHGTLVRWVNCDKVTPKRSKLLVPNIAKSLGRIYRYFINEQVLELKIRVFEHNGERYSEKEDYKQEVRPLDPLFLMTNTCLPGNFSKQATSEKWEEGEYLFPDPKGDKDNQELYEALKDSIKVKFSIVKPEIKRSQGNTKTYKKDSLGAYYKELQGISIVRAGREIKLSDFGFITDVSDPRNRWWKVEVNFEPVFDEIFGIDNTKQNVHTFKCIVLDEVVENQIEEDLPFYFMAQLSKFIENQIKSMKERINAMDRGIRSPHPEEDSTGDGNEEDRGEFPEEALPVPLPTEDNEEEEESVRDKERKELSDWLLARYPLYDKNPNQLKLAIDWFFKISYKQLVLFQPIGSASLYEYKTFGHKTIVEINTNHVFCQDFIQPILEGDDCEKLNQLLLLFGSMVETEKNLRYEQIVTFRAQLAVNLSRFIMDWKEKR